MPKTKSRDYRFLNPGPVLEKSILGLQSLAIIQLQHKHRYKSWSVLVIYKSYYVTVSVDNVQSTRTLYNKW